MQLFRTFWNTILYTNLSHSPLQGNGSMHIFDLSLRKPLGNQEDDYRASITSMEIQNVHARASNQFLPQLACAFECVSSELPELSPRHHSQPPPC